jgi:hypothetical protein
MPEVILHRGVPDLQPGIVDHATQGVRTESP